MGKACHDERPQYGADGLHGYGQRVGVSEEVGRDVGQDHAQPAAIGCLGMGSFGEMSRVGYVP